jgi:hypothetical protein
MWQIEGWVANREMGGEQRDGLLIERWMANREMGGLQRYVANSEMGG